MLEAVNGLVDKPRSCKEMCDMIVTFASTHGTTDDCTALVLRRNHPEGYDPATAPATLPLTFSPITTADALAGSVPGAGVTVRPDVQAQTSARTGVTVIPELPAGA
jgi:hypothetical protein